MFRLCFSVVLVYVFGTNLAKHRHKDAIENKEDSDSIFTSVIENITRVNYELQELISNYKQLQKLYKSQENLESESTDGEIDQLYRNRQNRDGHEKKTSASTTQRDGKYPATKMIWSDDDDESNDSSSSDKNANSTENIKPVNPPIEPKEIEKQTDIIFVDTRITHKKKKTKATLEPIIDTPSPKSPKTRYSKVSQSKTILREKDKNKKKKNEEDDNTESPNKNDMTTNNETSTTEPTNTDMETTESIGEEKNVIVEKKLLSETFSPSNIWDEIINNKPIRLEAHKEVNYRKLRKKHKYTNSDQTAILRAIDDDPALPNITNSNQTEKVKKTVDNLDTNEDGAKIEFQATVLREAYGDACLKVVIKKCYKACKAASKAVCNKYKCKTEYKEKFNQNTKTGCLKEFDADTTSIFSAEKAAESFAKDGDELFSSLAYAKSNKAEVNLTMNTDDLTYVDKFEDKTRNGYLRACLPHLHASFRRTVPAKPVKNATKIPEPNTKQKPKSPNFNILRDKYERACEKISYDKCNKACEYAYTKTCEAFICNSSRIRQYKKQCKQHCKAQYRKGGNKSYSDNSDSIDSDSSSSSDSDSSYSSDSDSDTS